MPRFASYEDALAEALPLLEGVARISFRPAFLENECISYQRYSFLFSPIESSDLLGSRAPGVRVSVTSPRRFEGEAVPTRDYVREMIALGRQATQTLGFTSSQINRARGYLDHGLVEQFLGNEECVMLTGETSIFHRIRRERKSYVPHDFANALWTLSLKPLLWIAHRYPGLPSSHP